MNYYEVLGLKEDASKQDIRKAYKRLAQVLHPDKLPTDMPGSEKAQKLRAWTDVQAAYKTLYDAKSREEYDDTGRTAEERDEIRTAALSIFNSVGSQVIKSTGTTSMHEILSMVSEHCTQHVQQLMEARNTLTSRTRQLEAMLEQNKDAKDMTAASFTVKLVREIIDNDFKKKLKELEKEIETGKYVIDLCDESIDQENFHFNF